MSSSNFRRDEHGNFVNESLMTIQHVTSGVDLHGLQSPEGSFTLPVLENNCANNKESSTMLSPMRTNNLNKMMISAKLKDMIKTPWKRSLVTSPHRNNSLITSIEASTSSLPRILHKTPFQRKSLVSVRAALEKSIDFSCSRVRRREHPLSLSINNTSRYATINTAEILRQKKMTAENHIAD